MLGVYTFTKPFGTNKEGDRIDLDPDEAKPLVDAGVITEATAEDHQEPDEDDQAPVEQDAAVLTRALNQFAKTQEAAIAKAVSAAIKPTKSAPTVPATVREPVFKGLGELLRAGMKARSGDRISANKLAAYQDEVRVKSPLGANEGTSSQGGYFIKPEWYKTVWDKIRKYPKLLDMTDRYQISGNQLNINAISESSLADGQRHGGVRGFWVAEAAALTSSYPALGQVTATLNTNVVLVYVTNQLLYDANIESFDSKIKELAGLELLWQENDAVINGSGSSQPLGYLNQTALVTVAKSSNDSAAMFGLRDLYTMFRALYPPSRGEAVWIVNPEAFHVIAGMVFEPVSGSATTYPAFGGVSYNAADAEGFPLRIFGRPVIECLNCPQLGLPGDVSLCDLSQLFTAEHPEVFVDMSEHVQFTTLQTAFRFYRRYDIRSPWLNTITSKDQNYTYAPFVTLASRGT